MEGWEDSIFTGGGSMTMYTREFRVMPQKEITIRTDDTIKIGAENGTGEIYVMIYSHGRLVRTYISMEEI